MKLDEIIKSQYQAALGMLKQTIVKCPDSVWYDDENGPAYWHVAYHALFYTHLYLFPSERDFVPWAKHKNEYQFLGPLPWPPHKEPEIGEPYTKEEVLQYLDICRQQVDEKVSAVNFEDRSGFAWLPFGKLELQLYNIRHIQNHAGELSQRLWAATNIEIDWLGTDPTR